MGLFIEKLATDPAFFFMQLALVIFSICCHEYAHARAALWQGDSTAADSGHLTLNPLKQMGLYSLFLLFFIGIAWGQVPVNKLRMRNRYSSAVVAFAGPAANLFLFLTFTILAGQSIRIYGAENIPPVILLFLNLGAVLNIVLFVINILPVPMLDGWEVFEFFFPNAVKKSPEFFNGFSIFLCFVVLMGINYVFSFGSLLFQTLLRLQLH